MLLQVELAQHRATFGVVPGQIDLHRDHGRLRQQLDDAILIQDAGLERLVKNRDLIVKVTTTRTPEGYTISMQVAPEHIPLNDDAVRISIFAAEYSLVQQAGTDSTEIMLYNKVDPGGFIPTFALNWASRSQPFETFSNLKAHITGHQNRN